MHTSGLSASQVVCGVGSGAAASGVVFGAKWGNSRLCPFSLARRPPRLVWWRVIEQVCDCMCEGDCALTTLRDLLTWEWQRYHSLNQYSIIVSMPFFCRKHHNEVFCT